MDFINLTPHALNIHTTEGVFTLAPSGTVARVATVNTAAAPVDITRTAAHGECGGCGEALTSSGEGCRCEEIDTPWSIPTVKTSYGEVTGLPEPVEGVIYVVSGMVASASPREDVMSPGDLVRDENGRIVGCWGLRRSM